MGISQAQGVTFGLWEKCHNKKPYDKCRTAQRTANKMMYAGHDVHVYECPICGKWHVGHFKEVK